MQRFFIVVGLVIMSFTVGYGIVYLEKRQVEQSSEVMRQQLAAQLTDVQEMFRLARVTNELGIILIEVERNNFGNAKELATKFFDDLGDFSRSVRDTNTQQRLTAVLIRRDEITTDLTTLNPETTAKLRTLFVELVAVLPTDRAR